MENTLGFPHKLFLGPTDFLYAGSYSTKELMAWAEKITMLLQEVDVYAYFNNDISGNAVRNAKSLYELITSDMFSIRNALQ